MNFNFPDFIKLSYDNKIDNIDYSQPQNNLISINKVDYIFKKLSEEGNKGGNSIILKLYSDVEIQSEEDYADLDSIKPDSILKILKFNFKKNSRGSSFRKIHKRFLNEIQALVICKDTISQNIIEIYESGECLIDNKFYLFYTMEFAESDLKDFIELNHQSIDFSTKIKFCKEILEGIKELDYHKIYHRDIKPDNIFMVNGKWKLGDLGLVVGRPLDHELDRAAEFIGPRGWISPEAMNKYLTENRRFISGFDCEIDNQSDIFQLGKLFWYIFQHNAPIGAVRLSDFNREFREVFPILKTMLSHSKQQRYKQVDDIIPLFKRIEKKTLLG
ncbi:protein kinase domain-containing protein [Bizionia sp. KMM 8389]